MVKPMTHGPHLSKLFIEGNKFHMSLEIKKIFYWSLLEIEFCFITGDTPWR
jgi:hypothetical protein